MQYEDEMTPDLIKQWSVRVIKVRRARALSVWWLTRCVQISRSKRHLDATATLVFWQQLDEFVARNHKLHFLRIK